MKIKILWNIDQIIFVMKIENIITSINFPYIYVLQVYVNVQMFYTLEKIP